MNNMGHLRKLVLKFYFWLSIENLPKFTNKYIEIYFNKPSITNLHNPELI